MTIEYDDPRIIKAISRHDPILAYVLLRWDDLDWVTQKQILFKIYRWRLQRLWQQLCEWWCLTFLGPPTGAV